MACSSSAASITPARASMAACARLPRMSWRHSLRSKPIEAFISCMMTDGPRCETPAPLGVGVGVAQFVVVGGHAMTFLTRRMLLAAGATLPMALGPRKPWAATGSIVPKLDELTPPGDALPEIAFTTADGTARDAEGLSGQGHRAELLGDVVRAVRDGDAGAGQAGRAGARTRTWRCCRCRRTGAGRRRCRGISSEKEIEGLPVLLDPRGEAARTRSARAGSRQRC